jgi:hypothetical protein
MVQAPNWQEVETTLFEEGKEAIARFATEHPDLLCSFFAYYADPLSGEFAICIDTQEHALQQAKKEEFRVCQRRERRLHSPSAWRRAQLTIELPRLTEYSPLVDYFHFAFYSSTTFADWTPFFDSKSYPQQRPGEDDYLAGNTRIVLWKVLERLIHEQVLSQLNLAPLFRLGYHFHEKELVVLRILNWPTLPKEG